MIWLILPAERSVLPISRFCDSGRRHESWARKGSSARHDFVPCVLRPHCCRDVEAFSQLLPLAQSKSRGSCRSAMARGRRKHAALGRRAPQLLALSLPESPRARRREIAGGIPATPSRIRATMEIAVWCPRVGQLREEKIPLHLGQLSSILILKNIPHGGPVARRLRPTRSEAAMIWTSRIRSRFAAKAGDQKRPGDGFQNRRLRTQLGCSSQACTVMAISLTPVRTRS